MKRLPLEDGYNLYGGENTQKNYQEEKNKNVLDVDELSKSYVEFVSLKFFRIAILILFVFGVILSVVAMEFTNALVFVVPLIIFIYLLKRRKNYQYGSIENYYTSNLSVTLEGFFNNVFKIQEFMPHALKIGYISIVVLFLEQAVLKNFLFYPLSTGIAGVGLVLFLMSILMLIANRDMRAAAIVLATFSTLSVAASVVTSVLYGYVSGQNFLLALISLAYANWFSFFKLKEVNVAELDEAFSALLSKQKEE